MGMPISLLACLSLSPVVSPSSSPIDLRFDTKDPLEDAIPLYNDRGCRKIDADCYSGRIYGVPMNSWCARQITDMSEFFRDGYAFDEDISDWDVTPVTKIRSMFYDAREFNSDLSRWDPRSVTNMISMFSGARVFNSDLLMWNVSSVNNIMGGMFRSASSFDCDISRWNTSSVTNMRNGSTAPLPSIAMSRDGTSPP